MARLKCTACGRPQAVCICPWITSIDNPLKILILRHKSETHHAINTAEILRLSLKNAEVIDGEIFEPVENAVLVYPADTAVPLETADIDSTKTFIFLDGTWRKTRKMLYLNPWLDDLPKVSLPSMKSSYILRKKSPEGFSTLEAVVGLLCHSDPVKDKYSPLLAAMNQMMQFQIDRMGEEIFQKHFGSRE